MRTIPRMFLAVLFATALLLGACGGDDPEPAPAGGDDGGVPIEEAVVAQDNSFTPNDITGAAGTEVTVQFTNDGENPHTFSSEDLGFDTGTIDSGGTASVSFTIPEAAATFQCNIHAGSGMTGTITPAG